MNVKIHQILKEKFGFDSFRPGQESVIEAVLAGRNILAVMPTGSGKSLCYQVPALMLDGLTIVVSPLVALMRDQVAALKLAGIAADGIHSGNERAENVEAWRRAASGQTRLLYMSPERLTGERMLAALSRLPIRLIAIDEAHCVSQWGPAFRPEYAELNCVGKYFPDAPVIAMTATADVVTREDIAARLFGQNVEQFVLGFNRPNIRLTVKPKEQEKRQIQEFVDLNAAHSGIVYCLSRRKTEEVAEQLSRSGIRALTYHAGMDSRERETNQNIFMTEPRVVIVATIAFGMGIDKSDVRYVLHTDLPGSLEAYFQEIGRAGRDGQPAEACMLYGISDIRMRRQFIENEDAGPQRRRREHKRLDALLGYCEAPVCRRTTLLRYFGEASDPCANCDVCLFPSERLDGTQDARKIMSAAVRTGEKFGAAHLIDIVTGKTTEKIRRFGHQRLSTFGVGADRDRRNWQSLIRQLVASDNLRLDIGGYGGIALTKQGRKLLHGEGEFHYRPDSRRKARPRGAVAQIETELLDQEALNLLDRLKALRLEMARIRGIPAYCIFTERSLVEMVRKRPQTESEFAEIHGVGAAKLKSFATSFLAEINPRSSRSCDPQ